MSVSIIRPNGETFTLDAVTERSYSPGNQLTEHPIEGGSTITDHIHRQNTPIVIRGIVTESPYAGSGGTTGVQRIQDALAFLEAAAPEALQVVDDRLGVFEDMGLVSWPHRLNQRRNLSIVITLKQMRFAEAGFVDIPPEVVAETVDSSAPEEQDVGEQPAESTLTVEGDDTEQATEDKSILADLLGL